MLASASLGEEGVERIVTASNGLVGWHLAIRLDAVLEALFTRCEASTVRQMTVRTSARATDYM